MSDIEEIKDWRPSCFYCKYCKFVRRDTYGNWKIKCEKRFFSFKVPFRFPQVGCGYFKTKGENK